MKTPVFEFFLIQIIAKFFRAPIFKNICERLFLKMFSWNWEKLKSFHKKFSLYIKKRDFSTSISETSKNVCFYFMIGFLCSLYSYTIFLSWGNYPLELIKRRSKVQEKNMSRERALNFHQWKIFFENYKPVRAWLWLFNKFTYNDCCLQLFSKFIKLERGILPFLTKYASQLENYLSYEAKNFLVN